ncbi:unnamed protein product [Zymoseptoria tritici ST99CH_1A5]|uniref:Uncharacterized protein n=2 Tax=Zymoseptoria tritici TaxID=1047171 RepID=A0A2H1GFY0_ZYMTR|nr:unnamed protein product [Zymoseptoria tritici ST99CH_1E4]SMR53662.1 unnamed protein product [Zymoseptoria tritici ST99CH_3D1]SMY24299.1 unnamed protein product [Zymoseptoria tritici ST99CH_1A5]
MRAAAEKLKSRCDGYEPIWIRTHYSDEGRHQVTCRRELDWVDLGERLYEDSIILSDARYYDVNSWQHLLDVLPEIVVDQSLDARVPYLDPRYDPVKRRREFELEFMEESDQEEKITLLDQQQFVSVDRFVIIEDSEMYAFDPPRFHGLWLDDYGNMVRQDRITAEDVCEFLIMAEEGAGSEQDQWRKASIGRKYVHGAEHGSPFATSAGE